MRVETWYPVHQQSGSPARDDSLGVQRLGSIVHSMDAQSRALGHSWSDVGPQERGVRQAPNRRSVSSALAVRNASPAPDASPVRSALTDSEHWAQPIEERLSFAIRQTIGLQWHIFRRLVELPRRPLPRMQQMHRSPTIAILCLK